MANYLVHSKSAGAVAARPHQVVIVGCGFGGLFAAKRLRRADVELTVIDRTNHHLFQPLLSARDRNLSEGDIAPPIRHVLRHQRNTRVVLGEPVVLRALAVRPRRARDENDR
jgi:NADH:ubiquinone reductase (H+-translocating)